MTNVAKKWASPKGDVEGVYFHCPGCGELHSVTTSPSGWSWNGSLTKPTFMPSILVQSGHYAEGSRCQTTGECYCNFEQRTGLKTPWACGVCHSYVTDGRIQFLNDCTHALAGQTVDLPPWPEEHD